MRLAFVFIIKNYYYLMKVITICLENDMGHSFSDDKTY